MAKGDGRGGARKGAGKPKGYKAPHTLEAMATRAAFIKKVEENLDNIFASLLTEAKKGNVQAIKELLDRAWGKPPQALTDPNGGSLKIAAVAISLE
jgi:hypothetical protein